MQFNVLPKTLYESSQFCTQQTATTKYGEYFKYMHWQETIDTSVPYP